MTKVPMPREMLKRWLTRRPRMTLDVAEVLSGCAFTLSVTFTAALICCGSYIGELSPTRRRRTWRCASSYLSW